MISQENHENHCFSSVFWRKCQFWHMWPVSTQWLWLQPVLPAPATEGPTRAGFSRSGRGWVRHRANLSNTRTNPTVPCPGIYHHPVPSTNNPCTRVPTTTTQYRHHPGTRTTLTVASEDDTRLLIFYTLLPDCGVWKSPKLSISGGIVQKNRSNLAVFQRECHFLQFRWKTAGNDLLFDQPREIDSFWWFPDPEMSPTLRRRPKAGESEIQGGRQREPNGSRAYALPQRAAPSTF